MSTCKEIYLAGGCFWGVQEYFSRIKGVVATACGYANGATENPTYEEVCHANTGHTETVRVTYDPAIVDLRTLAQALVHPIRVVALFQVRFKGAAGGNYLIDCS